MGSSRFLLSLVTVLALVSCKQKVKRITTIFLVGDSTMSDKPFKNGNPERGWGQILPLYLVDGYEVDNHAVNGRSTKSFRDEGKWEVVIQKVKPGDYVIVQFGHNDQKNKDPKRYTEPDKGYRKNLNQYITEIRANGAYPILATPIVRRRFDDNGMFYDTHGDYPKVVREVAQSAGAPLLDLHHLSQELLIRYGEQESKKLFLHITSNEFDTLPEGKADDTHLSATGAFRICDLAKAEIVKNVPDLALAFKE